MSSDFAANYGYVLKINEDSINALGITREMIAEQFGEAPGEDDREVSAILEELAMSSEDLNITVAGSLVNIRLYYYGETQGGYDDLEAGEAYFLFADGDLFVTTPTEISLALSDKNMEPKFMQWVSYG